MASISKYKKTFIIRPLEHMYDLKSAAMNQNLQFAAFPSMNLTLFQKSVMKRPGYTIDRVLATTESPQAMDWYKIQNESEFTLFLTTENLIRRVASTGKTYTYLTPLYTTGTISSLNEAKTVVTGSSTDWQNASGRPKAGDYFAIDADLTLDEEFNDAWTEIKSVDSDTQITLETAYAGTATSGAYRIRKIYSLPTDERWAYAMVGDKFCFTNGSENVQYWDGAAATADNLDSTNAVKARYCLSYANRLFLADTYIDGSRAPWTLKWSKEGDPTNWTDSTAGENDFIGTESYITNIGKVLNNILVYKRDSIIFGTRKGIATEPVTFPVELPGIGLIAPYSLVHAASTNFFLGNDDFYVINGDHPESIGADIRDKFFSLITAEEQEKVWGGWVKQHKLILWFATTIDYGQLAFAFDYRTNEWMTFDFHDTITGLGNMQ